MIALVVLALLAGELLVEIPAQGTAIVRADGEHRVLGEWYDADWSPDGASRGRVTDLTPSRDGRSVLLGWREADEWRVLGRSEQRVRRVTRRFTPGAGRWAFPRVRGWRPG